MIRSTVLATLTMMLLGGDHPEAFVLSQSRVERGSSSSFSLSSTRSSSSSSSSSPYAPVDVSGPRWNGEQWENRPLSHYEQFARHRAGLGTQSYTDSTSTSTSTSTTNNFVPPAPPAPPLVRYHSLPEEAKADIADPTGRSRNRNRNRVGPYYYSPPPLALGDIMPESAQAIDGGARGTWTSHDNDHDTVQVTMASPDGRPLNADIEVYEGPDNTPQRMRIYSEDGRLRPFTTMIQTPIGAAANAERMSSNPPFRLRDNLSVPTMAMAMATGGSHSISIRNTSPIEFPMIAGVEGRGPTSGDLIEREERAASMADYSGRSMGSFLNRRQEIHGGHLQTCPFDPSVASVQVRILSQGLPIMAIVELWQGPGDVKTVAQVYCDNGLSKPFSAIIETPGNGNTIAIRNMGPTAFPIEVELEVHRVDNSAYSYNYDNSYNSYGGVGY